MIHKYKLAGYNIVLDVNSGGVHVVDDLTYDILDNIEPPFAEKCPENVIEKLSKFHRKEDILTCYDEVVELYNEKILFSDDFFEDIEDVSVDSPIKSLCLHVSHDCNLKCDYCFASSGDFGSRRMLMTSETGKKAVDFLIDMSGDRESLEIDFFGGEPLMNKEAIKEIVAYARIQEKKHNKKISFTLTTNGMLLDDDMTEFINNEMSNVVLSLDGRKEVNDRVRRRSDDKGSYDIIMPKFKNLIEKRGNKDYYIRGTFTGYNLDFSDDVYSIFEAGFDNISVEPVVAKPSEPYAITECALPAVFKEYDKLALRILESRKDGHFLNFFHFMINLDQGPCAIKRMKGCGCGNEYIAVTPEGDIYPCHQFVGDEAFRMGNIFEGSFDTDIKKKFSMANVYNKPECRRCWAKFYCSGGCNANNYHFCGDISSAYKLSCQMQKKRLECAIMLKAAETEEI